MYAYNNTVFDSDIGVRQQGAAHAVSVNNLTQGCGDGFSGSFDEPSNNNLSDLAADAPGPLSLNSAVVSCVDPAALDFHLRANDVSARDRGADLSVETRPPIVDDMDGQPRTGLWDIGADEY